MKELITVFVFIVTVIPVLIIGLLLAPFGLADDVGDGYTSWLISVCDCKEENK